MPTLLATEEYWRVSLSDEEPPKTLRNSSAYGENKTICTARQGYKQWAKAMTNLQNRVHTNQDCTIFGVSSS
jgi:hypothetical protein